MRAYQIDLLIGGKVVCEFCAMLKLVEAELLYMQGRGIADAYMIQFSLGYIPCIHAPIFLADLFIFISSATVIRW
jgi:hypothetical protein